VLASSVGQTDVQFSAPQGTRDYLSYANQFVRWGGGRFQDLIAHQADADPYRAAVYWRFLYEHCGGMKEGAEDPAAGMTVIRRALIVLYSGEIADLDTSGDPVSATPEILDRALSGSSCPFQGYEESLVAFARALYALRVDGGRCQEPGIPAGCGFYDPHDLYQDPLVETIVFDGAVHKVRREMMGAFGTDLIEVIFAPAAGSVPLTLEFRVSPAVDAKLSVQLVQLLRSRESTRPQHRTEVLAVTNPEGYLSYAISQTVTAVDSRLGLIVTRLDAQEPSNPIGEYTIFLQPGVRHSPEAAGDPTRDGQTWRDVGDIPIDDKGGEG
jgi:hypothetical protein